MFCLASRYLGLASETFVLQHARRLAPESSVFLTHSKPPLPDLPGPVLCDVSERPHVIGETPPALPIGRVPPLRHRATAAFLRRYGVETMMAEFGLLGWELLAPAKQAGTKLYVHFHGYDASSHLRFPKIVKKYGTLFREAEGFFAPSQFLADKLIAIGCPEDRIWITPCGIDPETFAPSSRVPGRCLAVGRFVEKKAPLVTVAAFAEACRQVSGLHFDFIGDGPLLEAAKAKAADEGVSEHITFHGAQPHEVVTGLMREASIFLQHSVTAANGETEGLPVSIMEAMSSEQTVISTFHSGIPEAVVDGESGLLVAEHDAAAMAEKIVAAANDPAWAEGLAKAARQRVIDKLTVDHALQLQREVMGLS